MAGERELTPAEQTLAEVLSSAIVEDVLEGAPGGLWLAVGCTSESDQIELARRFRAEGREVIMRSRTA
jgi:hypothetical protein